MRPAQRYSALALLASTLLPVTSSAPSASDPCAVIAGQQYVVPAKAMACLKSFPFNETLRQNVLTNVARVLDFFTFEDYYLKSPPPFQESTVDIRAEIARINTTIYQTDYDFNRAVYNLATILNDGHTRWYPDCYTTFQNVLPAPLVTLQDDSGVERVFVAPDSVEFISLLGTSYTSYYDSIKFDWKRLAGAQVVEIAGIDPYAYADFIASTESGNFLDHGVRVNLVFSSYRISSNAFSQRLGDIAGPAFPDRDSLTLKLIPVNSTKTETVVIPYLASYLGYSFTDQASYWTNNCAANENTNGVDYTAQGAAKKSPFERLPRAEIVDVAPNNAVGLPDPYLPTLPATNGSDYVIKSYILPDKKTGVMFVGSFGGDFTQFQLDVDAAVKQFKSAGVTKLLIDLTGNGGGYVCLGDFLHQYLAGSKIGYAGFSSTSRANPLAKKILANVIAKNLTDEYSYYSSDNWLWVNNNTQMPLGYNYNSPSVSVNINGVSYVESQRFGDVCAPYYVVDTPTAPPFALSNIAIVTNGVCASTCAMFSTLMYERHQTKIAVFGGKPGLEMEYKGMAGNQVLEWFDLDSEIKTAGVKSDPLAPPDLLVSGNMRVNWRTGYSWLNESVPIAYRSELPQYRFPYTKDTYNNPQNLWVFAAKKLLP